MPVTAISSQKDWPVLVMCVSYHEMDEFQKSVVIGI